MDDKMVVVFGVFKGALRKRYLQGLDAIVLPTDEALPDEVAELMAAG